MEDLGETASIQPGCISAEPILIDDAIYRGDRLNRQPKADVKANRRTFGSALSRSPEIGGDHGWCFSAMAMEGDEIL